jgi:hypothetical protein
MSRLAGPAVTRWYDPAGGIFVPITGSPFTNSGSRNFTPPGTNADGDGGWVLALEINPPPDPLPPLEPKFVQQIYAVPPSPVTQVSLTFPLAQTAGNANILAIGWNDTNANILGVTDLAGNTYQTAVSTYRGEGLSQAIYFCPDIRAGTNRLAVRFDRPAAYIDLRVVEYSGLAKTNMFDAGASASGTGTDATSGPVNTSRTNELLFGAGMTANRFTAAGIGWTRRVITSPDGDIVEDKLATAAGAYSATAPLNSGAWLMQIAAFNPITQSLPRLRIFSTLTNATVVAWPAAATGYTLQASSNLPATNWLNVTNRVDSANSENQVIVSPAHDERYFRLRHP